LNLSCGVTHIETSEGSFFLLLLLLLFEVLSWHNTERVVFLKIVNSSGDVIVTIVLIESWAFSRVNLVDGTLGRRHSFLVDSASHIGLHHVSQLGFHLFHGLRVAWVNEVLSDLASVE